MPEPCLPWQAGVCVYLIRQPAITVNTILILLKAVGYSYKRLHNLKMTMQQIKRLLLQPFRVVTVTTMEHSTTLETTATGGVHQRTIQQTPGTGN